MGGYTSKCEKKSKSLHPSAGASPPSPSTFYTTYVILTAQGIDFYLVNHHANNILDGGWGLQRKI
jgi:hypothetical protein